VLEELAGIDAARKLLRGEEVVLAAVLLPGAKRAGGRGNGDREVRAARNELPDQSALAGAGRAGDDEEPWPHVSGGAARPALLAGGPKVRPRSSTG